MQDRAVCFRCDRVIEHSPVYEAPCGHDRCWSAVWHGLCLMEWREHREELLSQMPDAIVMVVRHPRRRG